MIIDNFITKRGKRISVSDLTNSSHFKINVKCDSCGKERLGYWFKIKDDQTCHSCANNAKNSRKLDIGSIFGRLTVIDNSVTGKSICRCSCGSEKSILNYNILSSHTLSCGCLQKEIVSEIGKEMTSGIFGQESISFKNGTSTGRNLLASHNVYKELRLSAIESKNYACEKCGSMENICAHHIIPYSVNSDKFLDSENIAVLCGSCHKQIHTIYGFKNCTEETYIQFLSL